MQMVTVGSQPVGHCSDEATGDMGGVPTATAVVTNWT